LASFSILTTSRAAFTDTTDNNGNDFGAGTVSIVDDDTGLVMFNVASMAPGDVVQNCILVTYTGSLDTSGVRLYTANQATTTATNLAPELNVTIDEGTVGPFVATELGGGEGDCSTFVLGSNLVTAVPMDTLAGTYTSFGTGLSAWAPLGGSSDSRSYRITVELDAAATDAFQGMDAQIDFVWEAQS
jgi:hypothetical protein